MKTRQLLTIREQQFYKFLCTFPRGQRPIDSELARKFKVDRQRVHQLMARLIEKGYVEPKIKKAVNGDGNRAVRGRENK